MKTLLSLALLASAVPLADGLLGPKTRSKLLAAADEVAKLGEPELVDVIEDVLERAGETPEDLETRRDKRWTRALEKARKPAKPNTRKSIARKLQAGIDAALVELEAADDLETEDALAELLLTLDGACVPAHEVLGHVERDGLYLDDAAAAFLDYQRECDEAARRAMAIEIDVKHASPSPSKLITAFVGTDTHTVSAHGVVLHGGVAADRLERALRQGLRALAFSNWLQHGKLEVPRIRPKLELYYTDDIDQYEDLYAYAKENGYITKGSHEYEAGLELGGFPTVRDLYVVRWTPEAKISADIIWFALANLVPRSRPAYFFAGHSNWLCLRFLGTTKPASVYTDAAPVEERSTTKGRTDTDALWRAAQSGLFGARSYLKRQIQGGGKPTVADAVVDQEGKLSGVPLLIATVATEYLQVAGRMPELLKVKPANGEGLVATAERGFGMTLPEFDVAWHAYILGASGTGGLLQRVLGAGGEEAEAPERDREGEAAVEYLADIRERAFASLGVFTEDLNLYPELSANAKKHAAYLQLNADQKQAWPDAHEEYADREGFSPEGSWAGGHSVIAFDGEVNGAIDAWMATLYHRLPLLEPGLCGIGVALDGDVVVLDSGSLLNSYTGEAQVCWPAAHAKDVPLAFRPELPSPVPGEDQSAWGYPITVQSYWGIEGEQGTVELELFVDANDEPVDCHYISPTNTTQTRMKPRDVFCLIPKQHLDANTLYRVVAKVPELESGFSWTFKTGSKKY